jgi:hypothetical protein
MNSEELKSTHKTLKQKISEFQSFLKEKGQKGLELIRSKNLKDSNFHFTSNGPQNIFKKCADLEFESLEKEIAELTKEKELVDMRLNSGQESFEQLQQLSNRIGEIAKLLDEKEMRWLELSELVQ